MLQENDDMEELLRKAAENYPLKTDNADWEKVRLALAAEAPSVAPVKNKNYRGLWLLLLLLPLGWAGYHYFSEQAPVSKTATIPYGKTKDKKISETSATSDNNQPAAQNKKQEDENVTQQSTDQTAKQIPVGVHGTTAFVNGNRNKKVVVRGRTSVAIGPATDENPDAATETNNSQANDKPAFPKNKEVSGEGDNKTGNDKSNDIISPKEKETVTTTGQVNEDAKQDKKLTKDKSPSKKVKNHCLYAGVLVAPDLSTVKFQSVKNTGLNKGVIIGYRINKKLGIETGVMWDRKFYYSEGKYFNTGKIYLPPNAKITDVTGNCKMIELPVNVRYNVKSSAKATWFSTAGLSSYFMKQESYRYTIVSTGAPYPYNKTYKESSQYLLSVVNLTVGYDRSLGKVATLRIEPYVKLPLKGVGMGSLPITSLGVNLGITKKIF
jgi:hypothetical protein